jgi:hypothetical protein
MSWLQLLARHVLSHDVLLENNAAIYSAQRAA